MRIAIGALAGPIGGPRTYAYHLVEQLAQIDHEHEYVVLTDHPDYFARIDGVRAVSIRLPTRSLVPWWDYVAVPAALRRERADLYHNTRPAIPWRCPCPALMTIHDMALFVFPETFTLRQRLYLRWSTRSSARRARMILTVSQHSRTDIISLLLVPPERVRAVYNGVTEEFRVIPDRTVLERFRERYRMTTPVLLSLGTIQPRKNVDVIIQAFARLKRGTGIPHRLYIVGRKGWLAEGLEELAGRLGVHDDVVFVGAAPDEDLPLFYNVADVFINPSSYEGFGLTLLEAMACGVPVVTSEVSSIPEVVGDAALTVSPRDVEGVADAVSRLLNDPTLRAQCVERGRGRAARFHWRTAAEEVLAAYNEIRGQGSVRTEKTW